MDQEPFPLAAVVSFAAKVAAGAAALAFAGATALVISGRATERRAYEKSIRPRWTDAARWERPGRDY